MNNFELIDDYLSNRLPEQELKAFEQQLNGDPALREEVELQKQIIEGVRQARMTELKSMLNNVPVGSGSWSGGKIAAAAVSAGLLATLLYFYMNQEPEVLTLNENPVEELKKFQEDKTAVAIDSTKAEEKTEAVVSGDETAKEKGKVKAKTPESKVTTPVRKPVIKAVDPSGEFAETKAPEKISSNPGSRNEISASKIEVTTGIVDKKHNFHYQFAQGKLLLFGPFDKSLYTILEINGVDQALFLFYKENYYLLDETQSDITKLDPIRDAELLKRLRAYRGQ